MAEQIHPVFRVRATKHIDGNTLHFSGVATDGAGLFAGFVHGRIENPDGWHVVPKQRPGRPKNEPSVMAQGLHNLAALQAKEVHGGGLKALRDDAGEVIGLANGDRAIRRAISSALFRWIMENHPEVMVFAGDKKGRGRIAAVLEPGSVARTEAGVTVDGMGWVCRWGDRHATYGRITCTIPGGQ